MTGVRGRRTDALVVVSVMLAAAGLVRPLRAQVPAQLPAQLPASATRDTVPVAGVQVLAGRVTSAGLPLAGALIDVPGTVVSTRSDSAGIFRLRIADRAGHVTVRVRALGHTPASRTLSLPIGAADTLAVDLAATASLLGTVVTTATMQERYLGDSPVKVELVTPAFLQRNVSANLMDNVSFLPGLSQQVDCGVCFTNSIRINGMEGPYTAVLIDGAPMMGALASVYGLNSIDPALIEQLEIVRGPGSTLYGSEAMGGVVNVITKDARLAPRHALNAFMSSDGEATVSVAAARRVGGIGSLLSISGSRNARFIDRNADGFTDLPIVRRLSVMNKWALGTPASRPLELMARLYGEDRFGGVQAWTTADRGSSTVYGEYIRTRRAELLGTWRPGAPDRALRLDVSATLHRQDSHYGSTPYVARQRVLFAQGVWSPQVGRHALTLGATLREQAYADSTLAQRTRDTRLIPGVLAQDELALGTAVTLLGGLRVDHHRAHGVIPSPRLALKWMADPHTTVRVNAATGFRVVNLFTEDHAALTGAREVRVDEALQPERSATLTFGVNRIVDVGGVEDALTLDLDLFATRFSNRITGDFDSDPDLIIYRNLRGGAVTRGMSAAAAYATLRQPLSVSAGLTLQDVYVRDSGGTRPLPFAPRAQLVFSVAYRIDRLGLTVDWTGRAQGPAALPRFEGLPSRSPWFTEQHLQFTHRARGGPDLYIAVKNLFDYVQRDAIIDPFNPFGDRFDTARVFGPLQGRRVLVGVRHTAGR
ncbi:MAG: TonB-dependent receptor [Gemmatimonadaceae bacterium]|nr:TonB-dependent receptor [Gemmatimonadaceae bacterium]